MTDGDAQAEKAPGHSELVPAAAEGGLGGLADALREEIMVDVEAVLAQKADSLWKRGQAELGKMQQDRKEVASSIAELQRRQDLLIDEQTSMHDALLDITTKMEFVAMEMREALRAVGKGDGFAAAAGKLLEEASLSTNSSPLPGGMNGSSSSADSPSAVDLASALSVELRLDGVPEIPTFPAAIALPIGLGLGLGADHDTDGMEYSPARRGPVVRLAEFLPETPAVPALGLQSPLEPAAGGLGQEPCWPPAAPGLCMQASSGTLRADAPAFVPGGGI